MSETHVRKNLENTSSPESPFESSRKEPVVRMAIACNFCSKSIGQKAGSPVTKSGSTSSTPIHNPPVPHYTSPTRAGSGSTVGRKNSSERNTCSCLKPRARCSLCLTRLNTSSSLNMFLGPQRTPDATRHEPSPGPLKNPFSSFTVFCATCRHSGHASHYLEWFKSNVNCPVSGCTCRCSSLDRNFLNSST